MVGQPENTEGDDDGQNELLTADPSLKLGLSDSFEDPDVTDHDDGVGNTKAKDQLQHVLDHHIFVCIMVGIARRSVPTFP